MSKPLSERLRMMLYEDIAMEVEAMENETRLREARLAEAERVILRMAGEGFARAKIYVDKYDLTGEQAARATDSASVVQYKPCEICTTQSWCETHGCQCYPVSAVQPARCCLDYPRCDCNSPPEPAQEPKGCNHFPGQVNCEWCTEVPHE